MIGRAAGAIALGVVLAAALATPAFGAPGLNGWHWPVGTETFAMSGWLDARPGCWHLAQDMEAACGRPVYAIADGQVLEAKADARGYGPGGSAGGAIVILHKTAAGQEFKALYGHVRDMRVTKGGSAKAGQVIAYVNGSSPNHLHFGIHPGRAYPPDNNPFRGHTYERGVYYGFVDPVAYLRANLPCGAYIPPPLSPEPVVATAAEETHPAVDGERIVWVEGAGSARRIKVLDLATASTTTLPAIGAGAPSVSGTRIAYADSRDGDGEIYVYDLATGRESKVTSDAAEQCEPSLAGREVVWQDARDGQTDIYWHLLGSHGTRRLTHSSAAQTRPGLWRDTVVWEDWRAGHADVYAFDLVAGTERRLSTLTSHQYDPQVSGGRVVWADSRNGRGDVYAFDLGNGREQRMTLDPATQIAPSLSGGRLVWEDRRTGSGDIWLLDRYPSLSVRHRAPAAGAVTVCGTLTNANGKPFAFAPVTVETSRDGGKTWRTAASTHSRADGTWSAAIALPVALDCRARFAGDRLYLPVVTGTTRLVP